MEAILLDTVFELPSLKGVEEVVISPEVVEGKAKPFRIYAERLGNRAHNAGRVNRKPGPLIARSRPTFIDTMPASIDALYLTGFAYSNVAA